MPLEDRVAHPVAEAPADHLQHFPPAPVLCGVIKALGDRLLLIATGLPHKGADAQKVAQIGDLFPALSDLPSVELDSEAVPTSDAERTHPAL